MKQIKKFSYFVDESLLLSVKQFFNANGIADVWLTDSVIINFFNLIMDVKIKYHNDMMSINTSTLRTRMGRITGEERRYWIFELMLQHCLISGILIMNEQYNVKLKMARKYSFSSDFIDTYNHYEHHRSISIDISEKEYTTIKTINFDFVKSASSEKQYNLLTSDRFNLDYEAAFNMIDELDTDESKKIFRRNQVINIQNGKFFSTTSDKTNRVFTNFVSLKRELRQFCTIDGEKLESLDLKSSQPVILMYLIKKLGYSHPDIDKMFDILDDDIYNYFLNRWREIVKPNAATDTTREEFKTEMFKYIFKSGNRGIPSKVQLVFMSDFPGLYRIICDIKNGYLKKDKTLASELQRTEASIFIPVANKFIKKGCLSVHDELFFKPELKTAIKEELESSLMRHGIHKYELR